MYFNYNPFHRRETRGRSQSAQLEVPSLNATRELFQNCVQDVSLHSFVDCHFARHQLQPIWRGRDVQTSFWPTFIWCSWPRDTVLSHHETCLRSVTEALRIHVEPIFTRILANLFFSSSAHDATLSFLSLHTFKHDSWRRQSQSSSALLFVQLPPPSSNNRNASWFQSSPASSSVLRCFPYCVFRCYAPSQYQFNVVPHRLPLLILLPMFLPIRTPEAHLPNLRTSNPTAFQATPKGFICRLGVSGYPLFHQ